MRLSEFVMAQSAGAGESLDVFGPRIRFLTALSDDDAAYCLIAGAVPPA